LVIILEPVFKMVKKLIVELSFFADFLQ